MSEPRGVLARGLAPRMSRYWYKPSFWRWWWSTKAPTGAKLLAATMTTAGVVFAGYELTGVFSEANAAQVYTYVQTVRHIRVEPVTTTRIETVREHGRVVRVTVDPPPRTVTGPPVREFLTVTRSGVAGVVATHTVPVTQREVVTIAGPGQTVEVTRGVPVTRTETVGHSYTVTVSRPRTTTVSRTVSRTGTVTVQQTDPGQTVVAEHTVTQNAPVTTTVTKATTVPVTTTVTKATTVPVTSTVATTVTKATTVPVTSTVATTVVATLPLTTTVTHTITDTVTVTQTVGTTVTVIKTTTT